MKRIMFLALAIVLFTTCEKDGQDASPCSKKLRSHFKKEIRCTEKGAYETNLYKGIYKGKTVYYVDVVCISCLTASPEYGYTCDLEKVDFENFNEVANKTMVYNSCTKDYTE